MKTSLKSLFWESFKDTSFKLQNTYRPVNQKYIKTHNGQLVPELSVHLFRSFRPPVPKTHTQVDEIKSESLDELIGTGGRIKSESVVAFDRITHDAINSNGTVIDSGISQGSVTKLSPGESFQFDAIFYEINSWERVSKIKYKITWIEGDVVYDNITGEIQVEFDQPNPRVSKFNTAIQ
jgi:hypothetical protein